MYLLGFSAIDLPLPSNALQRTHVDVVEVAAIELHVIRLAFQSLDDVLVEVDLRELLRTAQPTGTEDVDLHQLVAHDIQPDQKHAVLNQFGPHDFGDLQVLFGDFRGCQLAASVDVAAHVVAAARPPKGGIFAFDLQRSSIHHKQPHVAIFRGLQILLANDKPIAADGVDHLIQIRDIAFFHEKHAGTAGALHRFEDTPALFFGKRLDLVAIARDQRARADFFGEELEIHLGVRFGEAVRIVHHNHTVPHRHATELRSGRCRPGPFEIIVGWHVTEHQHIQFIDRDALLQPLRALQVLQVRLLRTVLFVHGHGPAHVHE